MTAREIGRLKGQPLYGLIDIFTILNSIFELNENTIQMRRTLDSIEIELKRVNTFLAEVTGHEIELSDVEEVK